MDGPVSPRALIKRHKNPIEAFEAADPEGKGILDLKTMRRVLQNLSSPASAMEMVTYSKKYGNGDGKSINYRKFLEAHQVPLSPVAQHLKDLSKGITNKVVSLPSDTSTSSSFPLHSNNNNSYNNNPSSSSSSSSSSSATTTATTKPITSPIAEKRAPKAVPGNPARPDNYHPESMQASSRLLKFESDSHDFPHYIHGNPGIENFLPNLSMRAGRRSDYPQRELDYTKHKLAVIGSDLQEIEAYHAHEEGVVRNYSKADGSGGVTNRLDEPLFTGGLIAESGGIGMYINDVAATKPISDEYLPLFPGENFPRQKSVDPIAHGGKVAKSGNIFKFMNDESWKDEHPEGYLPPLPNGLMDSPRAIVYDPINQKGSLIGSGSAGIAVWANDTTAADQKYQRLRQYRSDPIYHSGEIAIEGGLHGIANAQRTWLQDTPTAPGMQYQTIPKEYRLARSASAAKNRLNSGKSRTAGRRRSLPDLLAGRYDTTSLAEHLANEEINDDENNTMNNNNDGTLGIGAADEEEIEKAVSGIARRDRRLYQSSLAIAGPLTDVTGTHHDRMIFSLGARSPVAVAMAATPLVKFDTRKLALVRKHIREQLPAKTTAAVAALKHRLAPKDGDKDGRLTDSELMSALTDMMPNLHAEEVGLVIRYMRQRNAKRSAAAREDAISKSNTPPKEVTSKNGLVHQSTHIAGPDEVAQMSVSTAGFGEGIDMVELADWITKQPGGTDELPNPIYAGGNHTITTFSSSPPSARELNQLSDGTLSPHSHKRIVSHTFHDSPNETHEHVREAFDSTAAAETIFDRHAPFIDPRTEHRPVDYDHDVGSLLSAHTLLSSRSKTNRRPGYSEYHQLRKQASSDFARGDTNAPAAGLLSGDKKKKHGSPNSTKASKGDDNDGTNSKEQLTAQEMKVRFDTFRTGWENKYGAPARKEMKNDLMEGSEGSTWTKATPTPFKVLRLAIGSPLPGSSGNTTSSKV